jgi:hypothetical protein
MFLDDIFIQIWIMKGALFQLECLVMKSSFTVNGFIDTDVKFIR